MTRLFKERGDRKGGVLKIWGFENIFSFRNCPVRDTRWVEKRMQRERVVPLGTGYSTDILSLTGQGFPVGDTFSTHILSLTGKRERTFFTVISTFFTPHPQGNFQKFQTAYSRVLRRLIYRCLMIRWRQ